MLVNLAMLLIFVLVIKHEPLMYSINQGDDEQAFQMIGKVYHASENHQLILSQLQD